MPYDSIDIRISKISLYMLSIEDFQKIDIRTGIIREAHDFPEARKPSYRLVIDFGSEIGVKRSCAQLTANYAKEQLLNRKVLAVVNLFPRQIGPALSEVLVLGVPDANGNVTLAVPDDPGAPAGGRLY